jgi:hypothetical protein
MTPLELILLVLVIAAPVGALLLVVRLLRVRGATRRSPSRPIPPPRDDA